MVDELVIKEKFEVLRILIVDDNPIDRELLKSYLISFGIKNIQESRNGNEAIFKVENAAMMRSPFHIILTDWKMPEMSGLSLLKLIKSDRSLKKSKVVMITSVSEGEQIKNALDIGVDDFLLKPIDPENLKKKILSLIVEEIK